MRQLIVIRHAKSDWHHPELADHDRPLNKRGQRDAPVMGKRLYKQCSTPPCLVSSSAVRALATARLMVKPLKYPADRIVVDARLYAASAAELLQSIREFSDDNACVAMIAHNPGVTELVNMLADTDIDNMPTCSFAVLNIAVDQWRQVNPAMADLIDFDYPKKPH